MDISLSAHANAVKYYEQKKKSSVKREKTENVSTQAIKAAERRLEKQAKEVKTKTQIKEMRKKYWFEKFHWFISSDNYIVISGRDMQQNEVTPSPSFCRPRGFFFPFLFSLGSWCRRSSCTGGT